MASLFPLFFYVVVILLPQDKKRNHILRFLSNKIASINYRITILLVHINHSTSSSKKINTNFHESLPSEEEMKVICKLVDSRKILSPVTKIQGGWFEYLENVSKNTKSDVRGILQFSDLLSSDLVGILSEIDDIASNKLSL